MARTVLVMWPRRSKHKMDRDIRDSYSLSLPTDKTVLDSVKVDMTTIKDQQGNPALEVVIDATHGGYVNSNLAMYTKDGQQAGAKSFFVPFPKPVLTEHDDEKPPIGRIIDAQYVDLIVDAQEVAKAGERGVPQSKITVKAIITDAEAIQKLMDGRFLTVSISGRPKTAPRCSICDQQIEGVFGCENDHMRGKTYDGKLCYYKIGEMGYSEMSFVNKPADQSEKHAAMITSMKAITAPSFANIGDTTDDKGNVSDSVEDKCPECEDNFWTDAEIAEIKPIADEYDTWLESAEAGDAVLTTQQRKNMKSSTFCGPARSFPVPDCKHAANAKARLTQSVKSGKLSSSTAAKIRGCINRKSSSLKCGFNKDSASPTAEAIALLEEARMSLAAEVKQLVDQKVAAEEQLKMANAKIDQTLADLAKAQEDLKKLKETGEEQHKQDLEQNKGLTGQLREKVASNVISMSLLLQKDSFLNVFGGNTVEDRAKKHTTALSKYKEMPLEDLIKLEKQYLDELTKKTLVGHNAGPITGPEGDPMIAKQIKTISDRKQEVRGWFYGKA